MSYPVSVYFRSKICLFANIVLIFDHFWPKLTKIESKMTEKSRQAGWNLLFNFAGICFRQNCLSALKLRIKIDFKFGPFSVHIYTTVLSRFIGLFFCLFELSETKISKINFWMKIFDTFRLCWNSQIWLDNHNNRYQYTCNIELERILERIGTNLLYIHQFTCVRQRLQSHRPYRTYKFRRTSSDFSDVADRT